MNQVHGVPPTWHIQHPPEAAPFMGCHCTDCSAVNHSHPRNETVQLPEAHSCPTCRRPW
jgi:hypothetical protein